MEKINLFPAFHDIKYHFFTSHILSLQVFPTSSSWHWSLMVTLWTVETKEASLTDREWRHRKVMGLAKVRKKLVTQISLLNSSFLEHHLPQDFCEAWIFNFFKNRGSFLLQHHCFPLLSSHSCQQIRTMPVFSSRAPEVLIVWMLTKFYISK